MPQPPDRPDDPVFLHARREAVVVLVVWFLCGVYTLSVCYHFGYAVEPDSLRTYWGIPAWVFFGVIAPWLLANVFAWWFCFRFVTDDDLGEDVDEAGPVEATEPERD